MNYRELDTPALLIDQDILLENLAFMQNYADQNKVRLRPHAKTHKMPHIAGLQMRQGANGLAVAKVGEAEVMAENGLTDIFIANQIVGRKKLERIRDLAATIDISFGVDCPEQVLEAERVFSENGVTAKVLVEIEVGENRSGVVEEEAFKALLSVIERCAFVRFTGIFSHDGHTYGAKDPAECEALSLSAQKRTLHFARLAREQAMGCPTVSFGSTPPLMGGAPILEGITEIRPGTYALMDASQGKALGTMSRCAATVLATVISRPTAERVILDVGAKGLTMQERSQGLCSSPGKGSILEYPGTYIETVFDEHAIINDSDFRQAVKIGDLVRIIPVHICPVCNLYDRAYLISGDRVLEEISISARGRLA